MPGVNKAELKARRRRSAAQLTGRPFPVSVGSGAPGGPNRESAAVAEEKGKPIDNQLRISFMTDKPNVKSWAEIEAEYKHTVGIPTR